MGLSEIPKVFIILVNWNGWRDTVECLHSLRKLLYANSSVIVVDNGSTDESVKEITSRFPGVTLIESKENKGFAGGNNVGIVYAIEHQADYVWLLNNDAVVDEYALTALVDRMEEHEGMGICGSKLVYYDQRDIIQALGGGSYNKWLGITRNIAQNKPADIKVDRNQVEERLEYIVGASMLVSNKFINEAGLLCEEYFLYYEELDWAMRAGEKFSLGFAPQSVVYHKEGSSTGGNQLHLNDKSEQSDYYQLKNRLKFTYKFFPFCLPSVYLTVIYAVFNRMKRGQWNRIPMILKLMFNFNK